MDSREAQELIERIRTDPIFQVEPDIRERKLRMLANARRRARRYGLDYDLTIEDVVIPDICPVLGIPLYFSNARTMDNTPSLDRIVPLIGYVKGNIQVISFRCNRIKKDATSKTLHKIGSCTDEERKLITDYIAQKPSPL